MSISSISKSISSKSLRISDCSFLGRMKDIFLFSWRISPARFSSAGVVMCFVESAKKLVSPYPAMIET